MKQGLLSWKHGPLLKALRVQRTTYTQGDVAAQVGSSQGSVSRVEEGTQCPRADVFILLLDALKVSLEDWKRYTETFDAFEEAVLNAVPVDGPLDVAQQSALYHFAGLMAVPSTVTVDFEETPE